MFFNNQEEYSCLYSTSADLLWIVFASLSGCPTAVFQLQRPADPAGLLGVPPHQQHREVSAHAAHPACLPPASGVASGGPVRQCRPAGQSKHAVSQHYVCIIGLKIQKLNPAQIN